ncbi:MAG: hypothetical protein MJ092_03120 [Lachnospiraceae bacterium]|nr:hypothetical protein [Lachnospiraceae bacterium]
MNKLINLRNKIEGFYLKHSKIVGYLVRLLISFACLILVRQSINFSPFLSNIWTILALSLIGGFIPIKFLMILILAYITAQVYALSIALGLVIAIILMIMYLLFFRFAPHYGPAFVLMPILFFARIPALMAMLLAIIAPALSVVTVLFGTILFYLIHFLHINAATFATATGTLEFTKVELLIEGVFGNREFLLALGTLFAVFMIVHFLKRISYKYSIEIAIAIGTGVYIILMLGSSLIFGTLTVTRLLNYWIGGLVSGALALVINNIWHPLDYSRTEYVEFEDDEYNYYVRAVPKATFEREKVQVKRINKRKTL